MLDALAEPQPEVGSQGHPWLLPRLHTIIIKGRVPLDSLLQMLKKRYQTARSEGGKPHALPAPFGNVIIAYEETDVVVRQSLRAIEALVEGIRSHRS